MAAAKTSGVVGLTLSKFVSFLTKWHIINYILALTIFANPIGTVTVKIAALSLVHERTGRTNYTHNSASAPQMRVELYRSHINI